MRRLAILSVAYPFAPVGDRTVGGAEQVLTSIDRHLHEQGHRSVVLACEGSTAHGRLESVAIPSGDLDEETRARARQTFRDRLHQLLREEAFDLVHMHGVDFLAYLPPDHVTTLVTLHLPLSFYDAGGLRALPRNVHLCCVSEAQRALAPRDLRLLPDVPNGVPLSALAPRADVGDYVLVLSRICPEKGIHHALDVARELGLPAVIAGRVYPYPEHVRYFEREVKPRLDAERRYVGPVGMPEKAALLARARCLLVPSLVDETSSLVSMEALASGTPVVALSRGALPTVIEHGVTGLLADDVRELAACVREVSKIDRRRCRERAEARFSEGAMCERYLRLYRDLAPSTAAHGAEPPLEMEEIASLAALRELAPAWRELFQRCADATFLQRPEWQLSFAEHLLEGELLTLALRSGGRLVGLVPTFTWRRGAARVLSLLGAGVSDYQTLLFEPAHVERCAAVLREYLESGRVDACEFSELLPDSPLLTLPLPRARSERIEPQEVCPALLLDEGPFERHLTYKLRANVRVAQRHAERDGFQLARANATTLPELVDRLWTLHEQRRAQLGETGCFAVPGRRAFHEAAMRALSEAGILRLYGMRAPNGELVGALYAVQDHAVLRMYQHGFDPAYARLSPGALLMAHAVAEATREGAKVIDFMRGDEPYKYRWGAHDRIRLTRRSLELV